MKCPLKETRAIPENCGVSCSAEAEMRPSVWTWEGICRCPEHGTVCNYCVPLVNKERNHIVEPIDMIIDCRKEGDGHVWRRNCVVCGEEFETTSPNQKCHKSCSVIAARIRTNRGTKSERNVRLYKKVQEVRERRLLEKKAFESVAKETRRAVCRVCQSAYSWSQLEAFPLDGNFLNTDPMNIWVVCHEHSMEATQRIYGLSTVELAAAENSSAAYLQQMLDTIRSTELYLDEADVLGPDPLLY